MTTIADITRTYAQQRDNWACTQTGTNPLTQRPMTVSAFAQIQDGAAKAIRDLPEFADFTPIEWEAFLELLPNMRKVLGMSTGEGSWGS